MNLTQEQRLALQRGEAVPVQIDGKACVVLPREIYDRVKRIVEYDDGPLTEAERRFLLQQAGKRAGWEDPEMDVYDALDPRKS